jgi:hypothetical protein
MRIAAEKGFSGPAGGKGFAFQNVSRDCATVDFKNTNEIDEATDT